MMGSAMIMGDNKAADVDFYPALNWYFDRFETALAEPGARLMVIGYGFRDPHINATVIRSVQEYGLKLFIIDPDGSGIAAKLNPTANAQIKGPATSLEDAFVAGVIGASRRSLRDIFVHDSVEFAKVVRFFNA